MRWRFIDSTSRAEWQQRKVTEEAIERWWSEFQARTATLDQVFSGKDKEFDLPSWMQQHLQAIEPKLMWEFGPGLSGGHRLVITPEGDRYLRPLTETILARAPELEGWEFYGYRLPESADQAAALVEARLDCEVDGARGWAVIGERNLLQVKLAFPEIDDRDQAFHASFIACETLLGEEAFDRWVGPIEITSEAEDRWLPLEQLKPRLEALIGSMEDQLPDRPCRELADDAEWYGLKIQREEREDYADQADLVIGSTCQLAATQTALASLPFDSRRYSRQGETFCYLKLDGVERDLKGRFEWRKVLEDTVEEALSPTQLGCSVGVGTGLRYAYIDLALLDPEAAVPVLRQALQGAQVPRRSWLLFHDDTLAREWVGVWDDSPAPPVAEPDEE